MKNENQSIVSGYDQMALLAASAQRLQDIKDEAERHQRRMGAYQAWCDPEAMKKRQEEHEKQAASALELGKLAARDLEIFAVPDPLPSYMVGQSAATIQSMLRTGWMPESERKKMKIGGGPASFDDLWKDMDPQTLRAELKIEQDKMASLREDTKAKLAEMAKAKANSILKENIAAHAPYKISFSPEAKEPEAPPDGRKEVEAQPKGWLPWHWFTK